MRFTFSGRKKGMMNTDRWLVEKVVKGEQKYFLYTCIKIMRTVMIKMSVGFFFFSCSFPKKEHHMRRDGIGGVNTWERLKRTRLSLFSGKLENDGDGSGDGGIVHYL